AAVRGDIGAGGGGGGVEKFADLLDVDTSGLMDGYVSRWVAASSKWEPKTPDWVPLSRTITINGTTYDLSANRSWTVSGGEGGADYFSDLLDIRWTNLSNWDLPVYSTDSSKWLNRPAIRADLSGIVHDDLVKYRASDSTFIPYTLPNF